MLAAGDEIQNSPASRRYATKGALGVHPGG